MPRRTVKTWALCFWRSARGEQLARSWIVLMSPPSWHSLGTRTHQHYIGGLVWPKRLTMPQKLVTSSRESQRHRIRQKLQGRFWHLWKLFHQPKEAFQTQRWMPMKWKCNAFYRLWPGSQEELQWWCICRLHCLNCFSFYTIDTD